MIKSEDKLDILNDRKGEIKETSLLYYRTITFN